MSNALNVVPCGDKQAVVSICGEYKGISYSFAKRGEQNTCSNLVLKLFFDFVAWVDKHE